MRRRSILAGVGGLAALVFMHLKTKAQFLISGLGQSRIFYVSPSGNDSNTGLTPTQAWQTTTKVSAAVYKTGDSVLFQGGQTFTGGISIGAANYDSTYPPIPSFPLTFGSYGTGNATISVTGANAVAFNMLNVGAFVLQNLTIVGDANTQTAIKAFNSTTTTQFSSIVMTNLDISGVATGIDMEATGGHTFGFSNVIMTNLNLHDLAAGGTSGVGIFVAASDGYSGPSPIYCHKNISITNSLLSGCGADGFDAWNIDGCTITNCRITGAGKSYTNGANPLILFATNNATITFCEIDNNFMAVGAVNHHNAALDIDGSCSNVTAEHNWVHDNGGIGIEIAQSPSANTPIPMSNITVRYNVTQNNATASNTIEKNEMFIGSINQQAITGINIHNNTFYGTNTTSVVLFGAGNNTGYFVDNICYTTQSAANIVSTASITAASTFHLYGNDYFGSTKFRWNSTNYTTYATWRTGSGQETISAADVGHTADPLLVSPGGGSVGFASALAYKLQAGSPMSGVGLDPNTFGISPGATDFFGAPVPQAGVGTGYNVGAGQALVAVPSDFVIVQRGVSQAAIQVLTPVAGSVTLQLAGGGTAYPSNGVGYDYWINGAPLPWTGGISVGTQNDMISRKMVDCTNSQWHMLWQTTPTAAAGEIVTYIEIGAKGDTFTPTTLAAAQALAPQLFV